MFLAQMDGANIMFVANVLARLIRFVHYHSRMIVSMTPEFRQKLKQMLLRDEKYEQYVYTDSTGHSTIGIGQNISPNGEGISLDEALYLLDNKINSLYTKMSHYFKWFSSLNEARQIALVNMAYNLGFEGFLKFHNMLFSLENGDMEKASNDMLDSLWINQVGDRANRLANIIRTGEL